MKRLALAVLALAATPAFAATNNGTLTVNATVVPQCSIAAATLDMGNYDPLAGSALSNTTTVNVTCTNSTGWTFALPATVTLNSAPVNATPISVALDVIAGASALTATGVGNGNAQPVTVRGTIAASGNYIPASYSGNAIVTVTF